MTVAGRSAGLEVKGILKRSILRREHDVAYVCFLFSGLTMLFADALGASLREGAIILFPLALASLLAMVVATICLPGPSDRVARDVVTLIRVAQTALSSGEARADH